MEHIKLSFCKNLEYECVKCSSYLFFSSYTVGTSNPSSEWDARKNVGYADSTISRNAILVRNILCYCWSWNDCRVSWITSVSIKSPRHSTHHPLLEKVHFFLREIVHALNRNKKSSDVKFLTDLKFTFPNAT